jgi:hypothetical protein
MNALYVPFVHAFILKSCTGFSFRHFRYKRLYSYRLSESNIHDVPFRVDRGRRNGTKSNTVDRIRQKLWIGQNMG